MEQKGRISFYNEISRNKRNSIFLIMIVAIVLVALVYVIGLAIGGVDVFFLLILAIIISLSYILISFYNSDKIAVASAGAKPAPFEKYRQYHNVVEGLCLASGMSKPKLYVMEQKQINAFATGRNPKKAVICVTTGALENLNKQELEGVIGHELSHIANYDIRFMTLTAVLVGMIAIISELFLRSLFWRSFSGGRSKNNGNAIFIIIGIALAILAPIIVALVQLAISRKREYAADSSAVKFIRSPTGLIGALKKIKTENEKYPMKVSGAVSPLFIAKPNLKARELFQTHPDINKRIEKLERM